MQHVGSGRRGGALMGALMMGTALAALGAVVPAAAQEAAAAAQQRRFSIAAQPLAGALTEFGRQAGLQISADAALTRGHASPGVSGTMAPAAALGRLLAGTGLTYRFSGPATVIVAGSGGGAVVDDGSVVLDPITVVGVSSASGSGFQGTPDWVYATPDSVSVVGREAIANNPPRNTADLFSGVSGTYTADNPQNPGVNVNIRGLQDQTRINMMIDGARQNFQRSGHNSTAYTYVDPAMLREVEVEKSVGYGVGGAGSLGGSVNFRTLRAGDIIAPGKQYGVELDATTGTNAYEFAGSAAAAARITDSFSVLAMVSRKQLGEYRIGRNGTVVANTGEIQDAPLFTGLETWSGLLKLEAEVAEDMNVELSWLGYQGKFSAGTSDYNDSDEATNHTVTATYRWNHADPLIDLKLRLWYNNTKVDQHRPGRATYGAFDVSYGLETFGGSIENTSRVELPVGVLTFNYGIEAFQDRTTTTAVGENAGDDPNGLWFAGPNPEGERTVVSGFATATYEYDDWLSVTGGLRYDHYDLSGTARVFGGREARTTTTTTCGFWFGGTCLFWNTTTTTTYVNHYGTVDVDSQGGRLLPMLKVAVTPTEGLQFFAGYSEGYRPPTIMETVFGGAHIDSIGYFAPNPNLEPETSYTYEVGANITRDDMVTAGDRFRLKAVWFDRRVEDYIALGQITMTTVPAVGPVDYTGYVNLDGQTRMRGVEIEANYDAGPVYVGTSFTYIDADFPFNAADYPATSGPLLLFVPPKSKVTLDAGVRLLDRKLTLGGRITHVGNSEYDGLTASQYKLSDYTVLDLYGSYDINENARLRFAVNNVGDVAYVPALGAPTLPAPGRTATMALNVKF